MSNISFNDLKIFNIKEALKSITDISQRASKEFSLQKMLDKMEEKWNDLNFVLSKWRDSGIPILKGSNIEEI